MVRLVTLLDGIIANKNFLSSYLKAGKEYEKRYSEFKELSSNIEKGIKEGRIIFYNFNLVAKKFFNVDSQKPSLDLIDYINNKYS